MPTRDPTADHPHLWTDFLTSPSSESRKALADAYLPIVRREALRLGSRRANADHQDLVGLGTIGLLNALDSFDPERGIPFPAYARHLITGSMKDGLRQADRLPRKLREASDRLRLQTESAKEILGRAPTETELAALLDVTISKLREVIAASREVASLSELREDDDLRDSLEEEGLKRLLLADLADSVLEQLSPRKQAIVRLYHLEGLKLKEIANRLGVTESRVSQLHSEALREARTLGQRFMRA